MAKAQDITITVPAKGSGAAVTTTISYSLASGQTDPIVTIDGTAKTFSNKRLSVVQTDADQVVVVSGLLDAMTVTGKASKVEIYNNAIQTLTASNIGLEHLTFTAAASLKSLDVSSNASLPVPAAVALRTVQVLNISGISPYPNYGLDFSTTFPNLTELRMANLKVPSLKVSSSVTTLDVSGNAIASIEGLATSGVTVTWGTQTLTPGYSQAANKNFSLSAFERAIGLPTTDETYSVVEWKKKDANGNFQTTNEVYQLLQGNADLYRFMDKSTKIYQSGTYQVKLQSSVGGKYYVIDFTIDPAEFVLGIPASLTHGNISAASSVTIESDKKVKQGQDVAFTVTPSPGYKFSQFTDYKGLKLVGTSTWTANPVYCVVEGKYIDDATDEVPSINATIVGNDLKVTIPAPDIQKGAIKVERLVDGNYVPVHDQELVPYGTVVRVTVTPQVGQIGALLVNGVDKSTGLTEVQRKAEFVIDNIQIDKDTEITATFIPMSMAKISLKINNSVNDYTVFKESKVAIVFNQTSNAVFDASHNSMDLVINANYQLHFTLTDPYVLNEIVMDGKGKLDYTENVVEGGIEYVVSLSVPQQDATIHITTKKLQEISISMRDDDADNGIQQTYTYDGAKKELAYTAEPNVPGIEVQYQLSSAGFGNQAPINAGSYTVNITRPQKDGYKAVNETATLIIEKAYPEIMIPTVTVEDGKYVLKNGAAKFKGNTVQGSFKVTSPTTVTTDKSHVVKITFTPSGEDAVNFNTVDSYQEVVIGNKPMDRMVVNVAYPAGVTVTLTNGGAAVVKSGDKFVAGTDLYLYVNYPEGVYPTTVAVTSLRGETVTVDTDLTNLANRVKTFKYTVPTGTDADRLTVTMGEVASKEYTVSLTKYEIEYSGTVAKFPPSNISAMMGETTVSTAKVVVSYLDANGQAVSELKNAGSYKVRVTIAADPATGYKAFDKTFDGFLVIKKATPKITWPTARPIAKGQTLSQAALVAGSSNVSGTFDWLSADKSKKPTDGEKFVVVFTPDNANYETVTTGTNDRVQVTVSDLQLITFNPKNGTLIVKDSKGNTYESGDPVSQGTTLTFTAKPDDGFELASISVNGSPLNGSTYVVGSESIALDVVFKVKEVIEIDPNSQYSVTLPAANAVRGVVISKTGTSVVKKDQPFSFTVSTLAADAQRVVVKAGGMTLTPTNGVYTINKVTANTTITVTLDNPTPIKAVFEQVTKNAKGYLMGTVQVILGGLRAYDQVYYYGDEVTLIAYPESGVTFAGWTDNFTISSNIRTVTLTQDIEIRPIFKGVPTDVESIESAEVIGGDDCIIIRGVADARVTIVSMDGRSQQQMVNGDTRINVRAGVYGVILEQGKAVIRQKIVVR